ncbi:MAG: HAMP domain-containing sensor histidine kinase [Pseudomonadota bacterium]
MGLINILAALLFATSTAPTAGSLKSTLWATPIIIAGLLQLWSWSRFRGKPEPETVSGGFLRKGEFVALLAGMCWGAGFLLIDPDENAALIPFMYVMQTGMASGVVCLISTLPRHTSRFVLPSMLPATFAPFLFPPSELTAALCVLGTAFWILLINSSIGSYNQMAATVAKTFEATTARNRLQDAIESTNDAFAFYDETGTLAIGNAQHAAWFGDEGLAKVDVNAPDAHETVRVGGRWLQRSSRKTGQGGVVVVSTDITDLKARERELVEARREAVDADAAKSRFLSTMSHELRTPLNIILGFSRLMASKSQVQLSPQEIAEYSDNIQESGTHLLRLIDDIIDYSKVGLDRFMLETEPVDLRNMLTKTITLAANFEHFEDLSLIDVSISPRLGALRVDDRVCRRIIMSLLTNAMRFRGNDGRLIVRAGIDAEDRPFIAIRDFGNGIPEDDLERVFEAFYQVNSSRDRNTGGTGLGLTLCRHLARLHGGDVILKSRVGVGTTATLVLPKSTYIPRQGAEPAPVEQVA